MASQLTHMDENNRSQMVDVSQKEISHHTAIAQGRIRLQERTVQAIKNLELKRGDILTIAQVAAIQGAKKCSDLTPMAHPLFLNSIKVNFELEESDLYCQVTVSCRGKAGVEMEALSGVSAGLLTVYGMCKALDKSMIIDDIKLTKEAGGKLGDSVREENV